MISLPIAKRELLVASRRWRTYWDRVFIGFFGWIAILVGTLFTQLALGRKDGHDLFVALTTLIYIYCFIAGGHNTSDSISVEKREGTIGLLFLTNLRPSEIIGGKMAAFSTQGLFGMFTAFPLLAIPLLFGGVTGAEVMRVIFASLNMFFFSACAGLVSSAWARERSGAGMLAAGILLAIVTAVPALVYVLLDAMPGARWPQGLLLITPALPCYLAFSGTFVSWQPYWYSLLCTQAMSWCLFALSIFFLNRRWQDKPKQGRKLKFSEVLQWIKFGRPAIRVRHRRKMLNVNAFAWLAARNPFGWIFPLAELGIVGAACWLIQWQDWIYVREQMVWFMTLVIGSGAYLKFWMAAEASRTLANQREQGSLELLMGATMTPAEIASGQISALLRKFGPGLIGFALLFCYWVLRLNRAEMGDKDGDYAIAIGYGLTFCLDLLAIAWLGIWTATTSKNLKTAGPDAVARGIFLPAIIALLFCGAIGTAIHYWDWQIQFGFIDCAIVWFTIGAAADLIWIFRVKLSLDKKLRARAIGAPLHGRIMETLVG